MAFDEPAIALAPTPREKWLACRIAMEEYGHHLKFQRLASDLGLEDAGAGRTLSVFDYELTSWTEFVVLKALVDLAEVVLMEELLETSYLPLRRLVVRLLPEEHFHVSFGKAHTRDLHRRPRRPARRRRPRPVHRPVLRPQRVGQQRGVPAVGRQAADQRRGPLRLGRALSGVRGGRPRTAVPRRRPPLVKEHGERERRPGLPAPPQRSGGPCREALEGRRAQRPENVVDWQAVDVDGNALGPVRPSPAAALRAAPVPTWPVFVMDPEGRRITFAEAIGEGGERVQELLDALQRVAVAPVGVEALDRQRTAWRDEVVAAGRAEDLEAALHVAMLVATERLDPADDTDVDAHAASGAQLWSLTGAVVAALAGADLS